MVNPRISPRMPASSSSSSSSSRMPAASPRKLAPAPPTVVGKLHNAAVHFARELWGFILHCQPIGLFSLNLVIFFRAISDVLCFVLNRGKPPPKVKPFNPEVYYYEKPKETDSRSPCPALNTLANHGYLPRDGRKVSREIMIAALQQGFKLTYLHAWFITTNGYLLTGQWKDMSLFDLCRHNGIEHNASLVHDDAPPDAEYAPWKISWPLFEQMVAQAADGGRTLTLPDIAQARVLRENQTEIDDLHAEIARGEIGLVLDIFGGRSRTLDVAMLRAWWDEEKFPEGWHPRTVQSLPHTILTSQTMKAQMKAIKEKGRGAQPEKTFPMKMLEWYLYIVERL